MEKLLQEMSKHQIQTERKRFDTMVLWRWASKKAGELFLATLSFDFQEKTKKQLAPKQRPVRQ